MQANEIGHPPERAEPGLDFMRWETLSPLVGSGPTRSLVAYPSSVDECREAIAFCKRNGLSLCARGSGHSYGDQALNDRQVILNTSWMDRILDFDEHTGRMVVQPGVQILEVYRAAHPRLFTLPASPSEATITVAGAIAANVNGKDSFRSGNFGDQVLHLKLLTASGEILSIDRDADAELFRGVVGGMGLLGIVVEATLQLRKIATPFLETSRVAVRNVRELLDVLRVAEATSDFVIAWMDIYARGPKLGRAVVHSTRWVERAEVSARYPAEIAAGLRRLTRSRNRARMLHRALGHLFTALLRFQRSTVRIFNQAYFVFCAARNRAPFWSQVELSIEYNFFPNLKIPPAALVCGPAGFTIQVVVPRESAHEAIRDIVRICQEAPCPPVTTILRVHRRDDHLLSFSEDGYSLNLEFHPTRRHARRMREVGQTLIERVIRHRGRVHLAKDTILTGDQIRRLYPGCETLLELKRRLDPDDLFSSDMARRLFGPSTRAVRRAKQREAQGITAKARSTGRPVVSR